MPSPKRSSPSPSSCVPLSPSPSPSPSVSVSRSCTPPSISLISPSTSLEKGCGGDEGGRDEGGALLRLLCPGAAAPFPFAVSESRLRFVGETWRRGYTQSAAHHPLCTLPFAHHCFLSFESGETMRKDKSQRRVAYSAAPQNSIGRNWGVREASNLSACKAD